ncbi:MAG: hypothetical protein QG627_924 [Chlamydiota bacterium]|jgi:hypothetical protein|nr:hypothetical protein [Chlamydiota bacterium]
MKHKGAFLCIKKTNKPILGQGGEIDQQAKNTLMTS